MEQKQKQKALTVLLTAEEHKKIKFLALKKEMSMKALVLLALKKLEDKK